MSDYSILHTTANWAAAISHQGSRVLDLQENGKPPQGEAAFFEWASNKRDQADFTHIEDHFFTIAVSQCAEHLCELHERGLLHPDISESFMIAAGHSKLIRNIREHHLEYEKGGGRQKNKNRVTISIGSGIDNVSIDASSVIITEEGRLIGGRLNVQQLMQEAASLHPKLIIAHTEFVRKRKDVF
jgi:hypothetical protein